MNETHHVRASQAIGDETVYRDAGQSFAEHMAQRMNALGGSAPIRPIEIVVGVAGMIVALTTLDLTGGLFAAAWWVLVLIVIRNDLADFLIPDEASALIAALGLLQTVTLSLTAGHSAAMCLSTLGLAFCSGAGAAAGLWTTGRIFRALSGREGLGFGDVKLIGASGIWLGIIQQAVALELAALAALAVVLLQSRDKVAAGGALPFGAFLAPAAWLTYVVHTLPSDWLEALP